MPALPVFFCLTGTHKPETSSFLLDQPLEFILYSRSDCPLCEAMEDELRPFIRDYGITVIRQYIDNEPVLQAKYGEMIPVLTLDDKIICNYFLDPEILRGSMADKT